MVMCAGFVWTITTARLSLLDKNISTFTRLHVYITEKSHTKKCYVFLCHLYGYATASGVSPGNTGQVRI